MAINPNPMEQVAQDFLLKQLPVIIVLGFGIYFMYKYFTNLIDKKDKIIAEKEAENKELRTKLMDLTYKNNEIMNGLRELIVKMLAK